jgi:hypothetical protein
MKIFRRMKNESIEDPHELLLSLVDLGSIDVDEMLIACVSEMSDAECKRVLNSLSLPSNAEGVEEPEDDFEEEPEDGFEEPAVEPVDADSLEDEEPAEELDDEDIAEVEARIRRLEKALKERCNKNEEDDEDDDMIECNRSRAESRRSRFRR